MKLEEIMMLLDPVGTGFVVNLVVSDIVVLMVDVSLLDAVLPVVGIV